MKIHSARTILSFLILAGCSTPPKSPPANPEAAPFIVQTLTPLHLATDRLVDRVNIAAESYTEQDEWQAFYRQGKELVLQLTALESQAPNRYARSQVAITRDKALSVANIAFERTHSPASAPLVPEKALAAINYAKSHAYLMDELQRLDTFGTLILRNPSAQAWARGLTRNAELQHALPLLFASATTEDQRAQALLIKEVLQDQRDRLWDESIKPLPSPPNASPDVAVTPETAYLAQSAADFGRVHEENQRLNALVHELRSEISTLQAGRSPQLGAQSDSGNLQLLAQRAIFKELLGLGQFATFKLAIDWIKADIAPRYASLIAFQTELTDAQRAQLLSLLAERYENRMEYFAAISTASYMPEAAMQLNNFYHDRLVKLVGDDSADLFEKSEAKPVLWDRMQRLDVRLRYEATPLNRQQYAALWPILSEADFYYRPTTTSAEADTLVQQRIDGNQKALAQAATHLTPAQTKTLARLLDDDVVIWRVQFYMMTKTQQAQPTSAPSSLPASP